MGLQGERVLGDFGHTVKANANVEECSSYRTRRYHMGLYHVAFVGHVDNCDERKSTARD